jgi:hypothetical protein
MSGVRVLYNLTHFLFARIAKRDCIFGCFGVPHQYCTEGSLHYSDALGESSFIRPQHTSRLADDVPLAHAYSTARTRPG